MVRIIRALNAEITTFNGGGTDAAKRLALTTLLNGLGTTGMGTRLEDEVEAHLTDYYHALTKDPGNKAQVEQLVADLRTIAAGAGAFPAATVIQKLDAIDAAFVMWFIELMNGGKDRGWKDNSGKSYRLRRITEFAGLQQSFEDVCAGVAANQYGINYNAHPYANAEKRLPLNVNYTTFDWIKGDGRTRGDRRGVSGSDGSLYVTDDHYTSFDRLLATGTNPVITPPPPFIAS